MRCKNCGWDNPDHAAKCEKCNAPLSGSMIAARNKPNGTFDEVNLQKTVREAGITPPPLSIDGKCPKCNYLTRQGEKNCPNCNTPLQEEEAEKEVIHASPSNPKQPFKGGTIISHPLADAMTPNKKLVGFLVTYSATPNGEAFFIYEGRNYVGRDASADIRLSHDTQVSGIHLSILYRPVDKRFKFKDQQSSNATFVNEELMDEGELHNFDIIRIGNTRLIFIAIPQ
ncbi:MAG: FHA domain-containing protein [Odoribacteraceae bacterium]|jgi:hypothetical protein|nr:FHA domain-containing protein [Odoribacteraceae bacterium]